jgi:single-strand DNA-binding protein
MFQKIVIIGHLGGDPQMRYTPQGTPVTNFSVATNRKWTNSDGTPGESATWFKVTCWKRLAEVTNQYLAKGALVFIEGELLADTDGNPKVWTDSGGTPRASFEVRANVVKFLQGGRQEQEQQEPEPEQEGLPF